MSTLHAAGIEVGELVETLIDMLVSDEEWVERYPERAAKRPIRAQPVLVSKIVTHGERKVHVMLSAEDAWPLADEDVSVIVKRAHAEGCFVTPSGVRCILRIAGLWRADQAARRAPT